MDRTFRQDCPTHRLCSCSSIFYSLDTGHMFKKDSAYTIANRKGKKKTSKQITEAVSGWHERG